jgi:hypothetical protein
MEGEPRKAAWEENEPGIGSRVHKEPVLGSQKNPTGQLGCSSEPDHTEPVCLRSWVPTQQQQTRNGCGGIHFAIPTLRVGGKRIRSSRPSLAT